MKSKKNIKKNIIIYLKLFIIKIENPYFFIKKIYFIRKIPNFVIFVYILIYIKKKKSKKRVFF